MTSPAVLVVASHVRRRLLVLVIAAAIAVAGLVLPQSTPDAHAGQPRLTTATLTSYAGTMLQMLNAERRLHHERPLVMNWRLQLSAYRHNKRMAATNTMSHQLPSEPFFATRISNAGYRWQSAGENIGWNSDVSVTGLLSLEREMYNEKAPNNGHRLNILSTGFTQVGINVFYDAVHHKIWFTQDFGHPAG